MKENKKYKSIPTTNMIKYLSDMQPNWDTMDVENKRILYDKIRAISELYMKKIVDIIPPETYIQKLILEKLTNMETDIKEMKTDIKVLNDKVDKLEVRMDKLETKVNKIEKDVEVLKQDVDAIKQCPTIKKELETNKTN